MEHKTRRQLQIHSTIPTTSGLPARVCMGGSYPSEGRQLHPEQNAQQKQGSHMLLREERSTGQWASSAWR